MPFTFLEGEHLAMLALMNLKGVRPKGSGFLPYGMPTYLAFSTDCVPHLLGRFALRGLFFHLEETRPLTGSLLSSLSKELSPA
jgi:hypothetical protein